MIKTEEEIQERLDIQSKNHYNSIYFSKLHTHVCMHTHAHMLVYSLSLKKEEHKVQVFENNVRRKTFGLTQVEVS
jgi:hypothetical protein